MDIFTRFNRKAIATRQVDTLIGLCKGITADSIVSQAEAEMLLTWLIQAQQAIDNPVVVNLLTRVQAMLRDGVLDADEAAELLGLLRRFTGAASVAGEIAKPTTLPLDQPPPAIAFPGKCFVFTGTCVFGTRAECEALTAARGGITHGTITKHVDYLVLGTYVTESWIHETYGRKIEKAIEYRGAGVRLAIVNEQHWVAAAQAD